ncbi:hypothetical protein P692DRAFT_20839402 [Suillus brevipes Sb2]|nr:hypothetical protein P692DRAFT_20839402 [Suillus brevipes Sb2]
MPIRAKHRMRYICTYVFVIDTGPRASRSIDNTSLHAMLGQVREPVKYLRIVCRKGSERDCTRPDER